MRIDKEQVYRLLISDGFNISIEELDEVLLFYDNCVNIINEHTNYKYEVNANYKIYSNLDYLNDENFYTLLKYIIELKQLDLLIFFDYATMCDDVEVINGVLNYLIHDYRKYNYNDKNKYIYRYAELNSNHLDWISYEKIKNIDGIPDYYKEIINVYDEAYGKYFINDITYDMIPCSICYEYFLSMSYFYFLINGLLEKEKDQICDFIMSTSEDIAGLLDRFNIVGVRDSWSTMNYVDTLYRNFNHKAKIIK